MVTTSSDLATLSVGLGSRPNHLVLRSILALQLVRLDRRELITLHAYITRYTFTPCTFMCVV